MPGLASLAACVAALASTLLYSVLLLRPPALSLQKSYFGKQQRLRHRRVVSCYDQPPPIWPKSLIFVQQRVPDSDSKVGPAKTVTYYDHDLGGNLIQITPEGTDGDHVLWDLELNSGHSYYFYPSTRKCQKVDFPVGILRPNWLEGATPLGPSLSWDGSGRNVCGWTKVDFIDYYADATTGIPDSWYFHTMKASFEVLNYTENPSIDPALFDPPDYCTKHQ
jgi:hypothetical protein